MVKRLEMCRKHADAKLPVSLIKIPETITRKEKSLSWLIALEVTYLVRKKERGMERDGQLLSSLRACCPVTFSSSMKLCILRVLAHTNNATLGHTRTMTYFSLVAF